MDEVPPSVRGRNALRSASPSSSRRILAAAAVLALLGLGAVPAQEGGTGRVDPPRSCAEVAAATSRGGAEVAGRSASGMGCAPPARRDGLVRVVRVVDGDTIEIAGGDRVRYIGIDAPELRPAPEPQARAATEANKRLVEGRYVRLIAGVQDRDRFGRLLRYVMAGEVLVEAELVREGLARAREYQPGQPYAACTAALEQEARQARRGIWGS